MVQLPVAQYAAHEPRRQSLVAGPVCVAVDQRRCVRALHRFDGRGAVHIEPRAGAAGLVLLALRAHLPRQHVPLRQRLGQHGGLPRGAAHFGAQALVVEVGAAPRIAVRQQNARAKCAQHHRVGQGLHTARAQHVGAEQEVAVTDHEGDVALGRCGAEHRSTTRLEAFEAHVVTDPGFEQVTEDEHRISRRVLKVSRKGVEAARCVFGQVQVADEVDGLPGRVCVQLRQVRGHVRRPCVGRLRRRALR